MNVPIAVVAFIGAILFIHKAAPAKGVRLAIAGVLLAGLGLA